jgi:nitronate monooxygenase
VGTLSVTGHDEARVRELLQRAVSTTSGVLAANFVTGAVDRGAVAEAARHVRLVDFFWSDPDPSLVGLVHSEGGLVGWQVGSLGEARAAAAAGCDVVTVQGHEAGGHVRGAEALLPLLRAVVGELEVPVLAAGGIADASAVAAAMAAGAAGVRVGTRFVATVESGAHPAYWSALVAAGTASTEVTDAFAVCPLCATSPRARVLSSAVSAVGAFTGEVVGAVRSEGRTTPVLRGSGMPPTDSATGQVEAMAMYAGTGVTSIHDVVPAGEVVARLAAGANGGKGTHAPWC